MSSELKFEPIFEWDSERKLELIGSAPDRGVRFGPNVPDTALAGADRQVEAQHSAIKARYDRLMRSHLSPAEECARIEIAAACEVPNPWRIFDWRVRRGRRHSSEDTSPWAILLWVRAARLAEIERSRPARIFNTFFIAQWRAI